MKVFNLVLLCFVLAGELHIHKTLPYAQRPVVVMPSVCVYKVNIPIKTTKKKPILIWSFLIGNKS